jgi:hypothetical protein
MRWENGRGNKGKRNGRAASFGVLSASCERLRPGQPLDAKPGHASCQGWLKMRLRNLKVGVLEKRGLHPACSFSRSRS